MHKHLKIDVMNEESKLIELFGNKLYKSIKITYKNFLKKTSDY